MYVYSKRYFWESFEWLEIFNSNVWLKFFQYVYLIVLKYLFIYAIWVMVNVAKTKADYQRIIFPFTSVILSNTYLVTFLCFTTLEFNKNLFSIFSKYFIKCCCPLCGNFLIFYLCYQIQNIFCKSILIMEVIFHEQFCGKKQAFMRKKTVLKNKFQKSFFFLKTGG